MSLIAIIGQKGSGKSLSACRLAIIRKNKSFCNFNIRSPYYTRLKMKHIICEMEIKREDKKALIKNVVNYAFWNEQLKKYKGYDIFIDEIHNIAHSRRAMSTINVMLTKWMAQIRKILGDSEVNHLYMISQKLERIDVAFRDLLDKVIYVRKVQLSTFQMTTVYKNGRKLRKKLPIMVIIQYHFNGEYCVENLQKFLFFGEKSYTYRNWFYGNDFYRYFDSYELIQMGEDDFL